MSYWGGGIYYNAAHPLQIDDVWMFFNILNQEPVPNGYFPHIGRFYPLGFLDLNFLRQFSQSPKLFFFVNALDLFFMAFIAYKLVLYIWGAESKSTFLALLIVFVVVFLNVGFIMIITGICYPERMQMIFLSIFALSLYMTQKNPHRFWFVVCFLSGAISLFYKETDFIFIGGFGALYLVLKLLQAKLHHQKSTFLEFIRSNPTHILALALFVSAICFVGIYVSFIIPQIQISNPFDQKTANGFLIVIKDIANTFLNHPFVFVYLSCIVIVRLVDFYKNKTLYPLYDALLLGALGVGFGYFVLRFFWAYYFTPCYIMGLLPALFFTKIYFKPLKPILILTLILHCAINLPLSLSTYTKTKMLPPHYAKAMEFMAQYTHTHDKPNIFLLGQNRDPDGLMLYGFVKDFLHYYGAKDFDLQTSKANPSTAYTTNLDSPLSIFNSNEVATPKKGDLLYLDNLTKDFVDERYLNDLNTRYKLIFESQFFGVYNLNFKAILKYIFKESQTYRSYLSVPRVSENIFGAPLFVRVYEVQ